MRGAEGEAVLPVLRTLRNKADAVGSARPEGENAGLLEISKISLELNNESAFL
jgi:hypothetical protein